MIVLKKIRLTKQESDKILKNMKNSGTKLKTKRIKAIKFHKSFDKGMRLAVCLNCGYPSMFIGLPQLDCGCKKQKIEVYSMNKLMDFVLKLQEIYYEKEQKSQKGVENKKEEISSLVASIRKNLDEACIRLGQTHHEGIALLFFENAQRGLDNAMSSCKEVWNTKKEVV